MRNAVFTTQRPYNLITFALARTLDDQLENPKWRVVNLAATLFTANARNSLHILTSFAVNFCFCSLSLSAGVCYHTGPRIGSVRHLLTRSEGLPRIPARSFGPRRQRNLFRLPSAPLWYYCGFQRKKNRRKCEFSLHSVTF